MNSLAPGFRAQPAPVINLNNAAAIAFGRNDIGQGLAVRADGTVWAWGPIGWATTTAGVPSTAGWAMAARSRSRPRRCR
jgi:hypothetical protein